MASVERSSPDCAREDKMPTAFYYREQARICREQAEITDSLTAEHLLFLADEYEAEAERVESDSDLDS